MALNITVGNYDRRVSLLSRGDVIGPGGSSTKTFTLISKVWAKIDTQSTRPSLVAEGNKIEYNVRHYISFPYSTSYKAARRITYEYDGETRTFSVQNWINTGQRNEQLTAECIEVESRSS